MLIGWESLYILYLIYPGGKVCSYGHYPGTQKTTQLLHAPLANYGLVRLWKQEKHVRLYVIRLHLRKHF